MELPIDFEMVFRKGLVLGGGGTRASFQAGAVDYLYNVKQYRPDAITGASAGSVNAVELAMGDDPTVTKGNAANRLVAWWTALVDESSMWDEEPWLKTVQASTRKLVRSLSIEGLLALPYTVISDVGLASEIINAWNNARPRGPFALFNLNPTETLLLSAFGADGQNRIRQSGIKVRLVAVSLETGELVMTTETGGAIALGPTPIRPASVPPSPAPQFVSGAIASATMPCVFPARRIGDHMCVDGGSETWFRYRLLSSNSGAIR